MVDHSLRVQTARECVVHARRAIAAIGMLAESKSAALYVYKGVMSAKTIEAKLDALAG